MNIGNILKVADTIEQSRLPNTKFDMSNWVAVQECGTSACIAGQCYLLAGAPLRDGGDLYDRATGMTIPLLSYGNTDMVVPVAAEFLGLTKEQAKELFMPYWGDLDKITAEHAVRCLRNLAITGVINWEAAMKPADPAVPALPVRKPALT